MPVLHKRDCWRDGYGNQYCDSSPWNDWVRWLVLVIIVVAAFLLFVLCSCITARRRRRAGRQPYWGTGWATRHGHGEPMYYGGGGGGGGAPPPGQPPYNNAQPYYYPQAAPPAPPYSPPVGGYYANQPNGGYETGTVQQPQPAYTHESSRAGDSVYGSDSVYTPPPGPPPNKKDDGVVR